jgi:DNA ligase (NAD+)
MLGLDSTTDPAVIAARLGQHPPFVVQPKIDGVSLSLVYIDGRLSRAATRGDGHTGDAATEVASRIRGVPMNLSGVSAPAFLDVRGEVFVTLADLREINAEREAAGLPRYASSRHAASGILRSGAEVRRLRFVAHSFGEGMGTVFSYGHCMLRLQGLGFDIGRVEAVLHIKTALTIADAWRADRDSLEYAIDGAVIKIDNRFTQSELGESARAPRWAMALKWAPPSALTRVTGYTTSTGATGAVTPIALLEPVVLEGCTIQRVSLHNWDHVKVLDVRVGDTVRIALAGDVAPVLAAVLREQRDGTETPILRPETCEACGSPLVTLPGESAARCEHAHCPSVMAARLTQIPGIGPAMAARIAAIGPEAARPRSLSPLRLELGGLTRAESRRVCAAIIKWMHQ